jgi:hypothetical protein
VFPSNTVPKSSALGTIYYSVFFAVVPELKTAAAGHRKRDA